MNFALFFVCVLVAIQDSKGETPQPDNNALTDIMSTIKSMVEYITNAIRNITAQLPPVFEHMKTEIQEIVSQIPHLVAVLQDKLQELLQEGAKCTSEHKFDFIGLYRCMMDTVEPLVPEVQEMWQEVMSAYVVAKVSTEDDGYNLTNSAIEAGSMDAKYANV